MKQFGEKRLQWYANQALHYYEKAEEYQAKGNEFAKKAAQEADLIFEKREEYVNIRLKGKKAELDKLIADANGTTARVAADQVALAPVQRPSPSSTASSSQSRTGQRTTVRHLTSLLYPSPSSSQSSYRRSVATMRTITLPRYPRVLWRS